MARKRLRLIPIVEVVLPRDLLAADRGDPSSVQDEPVHRIGVVRGPYFVLQI